MAINNPQNQGQITRGPCASLMQRSKISKDDLWVICIHFFGCLFVLLIFLIAVLACYFALPSPAPLNAPLTTFSEARAKILHNKLVNVVGPRPYGSVKNKVDTINCILEELSKIQNETAGYHNGLQRISFAVRNHTGEAEKGKFDAEWKQVWVSMDNVIVTIHGQGQYANQSILVSGHYDSVYLSRGATDNAAGISSMMETIRALATLPPGRHDVIFAFVNGEEWGLLGAVDFAKFDPLSERVYAFLNVDGTPGTKAINFRSTGGWLDVIYGNVPRPLAFVTAGDLFRTGIIDSDTDWSVYSNSTPGLDFATFSNRQRYHTMKDNTLKDGTLQFQGDNLFAIVKFLTAERDLTAVRQDRTKHVYFSLFNKGYTVYTLRTSFIVHMILIALYFICMTAVILHRFFIYRKVKEVQVLPSSANPLWCLLTGTGIVFATCLITIALPSIAGLIASAFSPYFSYSGAGFAVFAFIFPSLFAVFFTHWIIYQLEVRWNSLLEVSRQRLLWGTGVFWMFWLLVTSGASRSIGSTYLFFWFAMFHLASILAHHLFYLNNVLSDDVNHDYFESRYQAMTDEEDEIELDDMQQRDAAGYPNTNSRQVPPRKWKAAFSSPDVAWFCLFLLSTIFPFILLLEVFTPFIHLGASNLPAWVLAPLIAILVFAATLNYLPLSRRGHHYGILASIFFIASIAFFFLMLMSGSGRYTEYAPYQVVPQQIGDQIRVVPELAFQYPMINLLRTIAPTHNWSCRNRYNCTATGFEVAPNPTSTPSTPQYGELYATTVNSSNSWIHTITFPANTGTVWLNGIKTTLDPKNATVQFLLSTFESTESWTIEYTGTSPVVTIVSNYDELESVPAIAKMAARLPRWATFKGRGSGLLRLKYSLNFN